MKSNRGMGVISLIFIVVVIAIVVGVSVYFVRLQYNEAKVQTIRTDMLLVQWKLKSYIDSQTAEKVEEINYLGTKVSEQKDEELIKSFLEKNILEEEEYDKYYVLTDSDLETAKLGITNVEGNYYLINYSSYEVIITGGCKISENQILYKLSDIEKVIGEEEK